MVIHYGKEVYFGVKKDKSYDIIKEADKKIKSWTDGFGVSAGLLIQF